MKTKSISKIISVLFALMMTTCLTSCEDERSTPVQGSGLESGTESSVRYNLSPTAPVETEPAAPVEAYIYSARIDYSSVLDSHYVAITIMVTNNLGEDLEAGYMVGVSTNDSNSKSLPLYTVNPPELEDEGISKTITAGEQMFVIYSCELDSLDIEYIDITLQSQYVDDFLDYQRFYLTEE